MISFAVELVQSLRPSKVDKVQHGILLVMRITLRPAFHVDSEDGVGTRGVLMDACLLVYSVIFSIVHQKNGLLKREDLLFVELSDINTVLLVRIISPYIGVIFYF